MYLLVLFSLLVCLCKVAVSVPVKITVKLEEQHEKPDTKVGCQACSLKDIKERRIEHIKMTILDKLHLTEIPSVDRSKQMLPEPLLSQYGGSYEQGEVEKEQYYAETKGVVAFAHSVDYCDQLNKSVCFSVDNKHHFSSDEVISTRLFIKNIAGIKLDLYDITKQLSRPHLVKVFTNTTESWITADVKPIMFKHVDGSPRSKVTFKLSCDKCINFLAIIQKDIPFVQLQTSEAKDRSRRNVEQCTEQSTHCCKESFYVSFKDFGWDNWIVSPEGYWANYCRGSCDGPFTIPTYKHTEIKTLLPENDDTAMVKASTCCSPTALTKLRLSYRNSDGMIMQKDLPNMSVEACGCA